MMTDWYQRSINALPLNGKGERTQAAYTRAVRMLSPFYSKLGAAREQPVRPGPPEA